MGVPPSAAALGDLLGLPSGAACTDATPDRVRQLFLQRRFADCLAACPAAHAAAQGAQRSAVLSVAVQSLHELGQRERAQALLPAACGGPAALPGELAALQAQLLASYGDLSAAAGLCEAHLAAAAQRGPVGADLEVLEVYTLRVLTNGDDATPAGAASAVGYLDRHAAHFAGAGADRVLRLRAEAARVAAAAEAAEEARREHAERMRAEEQARAAEQAAAAAREPPAPAPAPPPAPADAAPAERPPQPPPRSAAPAPPPPAASARSGGGGGPAAELWWQLRSVFARLAGGEQLSVREVAGLLTACVALLLIVARGRGQGKVITI
eukprot:TRINITY_DN6534_c1_g1_i1.p1 TRINITY_DN6534_c1_g1~~TRINITY_DN6534_c1_g1_i1.p1  ORF type:complete len:349 (+),score=133.86 TRINITY_DN6534_c1_g1_i1:73-1047(+)